DGETSNRDPFGLCGNAQFDDVGRFRLRDGFDHARAFFAPCSSSKIPKIFTSPVISKIFLICGFVHTRFTVPPCSRTRFNPPMRTPSPVESIYRTFSRLIT